eukprot:373890_1
MLMINDGNYSSYDKKETIINVIHNGNTNVYNINIKIVSYQSNIINSLCISYKYILYQLVFGINAIIGLWGLIRQHCVSILDLFLQLISSIIHLRQQLQSIVMRLLISKLMKIVSAINGRYPMILKEIK